MAGVRAGAPRSHRAPGRPSGRGTVPVDPHPRAALGGSLRQAAARAAAVAAGLAAGAVLAELLLLAFHLAPDAGVRFVTAADFGRIPGLHQPGQQLFLHSLIPYHARTDSLGYRGGEVPRVKAPGELRIFLGGDSFAFGAYVEEDSTLEASLERELAPACGTVRVINGGFGGSTITEEAPLILRGLALHPDLVLLEITDNDVSDLFPQPPLWDRLAADRAANARFPMRLIRPLLRGSALWRVTRAALTGWRVRRDAGRIVADIAHADTVDARLRETYRRDFVALRDTLAAVNVPLVAAVFPNLVSLRVDHFDRGWLERAIPATGVPTVALRPALLASGQADDRLFLIPRDSHPTPAAYAIAARAIAPALRALPALAGRCGGGHP